MSVSHIAQLCFLAAFLCWVAFVVLATYSYIKHPSSFRPADRHGRHYRSKAQSATEEEES